MDLIVLGLVALVATLALGKLALDQMVRRHIQSKTAHVAFLDLNSITGSLTGIIKVVAVLTIIGATIGLLFTSIADIVNVFSTGTTNSTTADLLLPVLGMVVALAGVFLIVRKVFEATK